MDKGDKRARAWVQVDLAELQQNVRRLSALLPPGCALAPVLKADAYGHGAARLAMELEGLGLRQFCVAELEEAAALRRAGVKGEILILGYTPASQARRLQSYDLIQTVADEAHARSLSRTGVPLRVHFALDTGMHRLGVPAEQLQALRRMLRLPGLRAEGVFTHLYCEGSPEAEAKKETLRQAEAFWHTVSELRAEGFPLAKAHLLSSEGLLLWPQLGGALARCGLALFGLGEAARARGLRPVLSVRARLTLLRSLPAGAFAGYRFSFRAERQTRLAVVSIGYADGIPRSLSFGRGAALLHGKRCPIAGEICMDQLLLDVTDCPQAAAGDEAVLLGFDGGQERSAEALAREAQTIPNEIVSRLGARLPRVYCTPCPARTRSNSSSRAASGFRVASETRTIRSALKINAGSSS